MKHLSVIFALLCIAGPLSAKTAADFTLKSESRENIRLQEQAGKVVLLHFTAPWCAICQRQLKTLYRWHRREKPESIQILSINLGSSADEYGIELQLKPWPYHLLYDRDSEIGKRYGVEALPATILINPDGEEVYRQNDPQERHLESLFNKIDEQLSGYAL